MEQKEAIAEMANNLQRDYYSRKEMALIHLRDTNFFTIQEMKGRVSFEKDLSTDIEYMIFDGDRVWSIETVTEGFKIWNKCEWINQN